MSGDCGIGQCNSTTGQCFCKSTNVVDIYGNVCPAGTTCGEDLYCHGNVTCTDSDGGKDYYTKGTIKLSDNSGYSTDTCAIKQSDGKYALVEQCGISSCYLQETYCDSTNSNKLPSEYFKCLNGCIDGACLRFPIIEDYKTVALGEEFYITQSDNSPYLWKLDNYEQSYLMYMSGNQSCSSNGKCNSIYRFHSLKAGVSSVIFNKVDTRDGSIAGVKIVYLTVKNSINFDISLRIDKYAYSAGETVNIISTLTGENYIDFSNAYVEFSVTYPDNSVRILTPSKIGFVSSGCSQSETGGAYSCVLKSSYSFVASYPITQDNLLGMYKAGAKARIGDTTRDASVYFEVKNDYRDYVDVSITPKEQTTTIGNPVSYRVVVKDNHPVSNYRNYEYEIDVSNLPYNLIQPRFVTVTAGSTATFDIDIFPSAASTERGVEVTSSQITVNDLSEYRQSSPTGAFILTSYPIAGGGGGGGTETVPIEVAGFRFTVGATLIDDPTVKDSDTAVLYVKYSNTPQPPDFPEEEIVTDYLREGWNLLNLPGKGTSFVDTTCSLQRKPFAYVYIHDQRRYATIQEAAITMGIDPLFEYVSVHPLWIYSYENCEISVKVSKYATYSGMAFIEGWNMVGTTQDMVGETMNSIKGSCDFEKIYRWNSDSQRWEKITGDDLIEKISNGLVIKTSSECNLKQNSIQPPIIS